MPEQDAITLGEGNTPLIKIEGIYFKCEFENPTGSQKDRSIVYQITKLHKQGVKNAVLSSSGNAAISAARYCQLAGIVLTVFVSPNINKNKLRVLENLDCKVIKTPKALSSSIKFSKENQAHNLRQSVDLEASVGYEQIAAEILEKVVPDAVFIPVSSGTTLVGIAAGFRKLNSKPQIHAVQTDVVHPIAGQFDRSFKETDEMSLADAIVAKYTPRESETVSIIKDSSGFGWVISNKEMEEARSWLLDRNLDCSYEGALTLAALWKATKNGYRFQNPVCLLTGRYYDK